MLEQDGCKNIGKLPMLDKASFPESCNDETPLTGLFSDANQLTASLPGISATGFAIPNGSVAPAKTWPPQVVPIRGSMNGRTSSSDFAKNKLNMIKPTMNARTAFDVERPNACDPR